MGFLLIIGIVLLGLSVQFFENGAGLVGFPLMLVAFFFIIGTLAMWLQWVHERFMKITRSWPMQTTKRYKYWIK